MPATPIASLREFTEWVEARAVAAGQLWFRGTGRVNYELTPSLYRHPAITAVQELVELEGHIITRFRERSLPYLERHVVDDWDYLFLMQHYGAPTRLLDWSENPYVGLFFALTSAHRSAANPNEYDFPAAVWVMQPVEWNKAALSHISYTGEVLSTTRDQLKGYATGGSFDMMNLYPVAMYGAHNSRRIVAQRGVFTIFGKNTTAMEAIYEQQAFPTESLHRLEIAAAVIPQLLESLLAIGFVDSVVYPDLDGLSREIKRHFKYRV
ncbi:MAG: FRG domain-containing protein [Thermoanaerobaculia bacterium]